MNGNSHHHPMSHQSNPYNTYSGGSYEGDRRVDMGTFPRHGEGSHSWPGQENAIASSSSSWNHSERGRMSSSPDATKDEDGDAKKKRRIQQACKACSLRRVKVSSQV